MVRWDRAQWLAFGLIILSSGAAICFGAAEVLMGVGCLLKDVGVCTLTKASEGALTDLGGCFTTATPCVGRITAGGLAVMAGFGVMSPGLQRLKTKQFSRDHQPKAEQAEGVKKA